MRARKSGSDVMVDQMIGRHVKSGWYGLADGEIIKWEPFGAAGTDVLVRDVSTGKEVWYASHSLTPIDGHGALPSRADVREFRRAEMESDLEAIRKQHVGDRRPWPGMEFGKTILGRSIDAALTDVRKRKKTSHHVSRVRIPDSGYVIGVHGGDYSAAFSTSRGALGNVDALKKAVSAAQSLANQTRSMVDIVSVSARGEDRYIVDTVRPKGASHVSKPAASRTTKKPTKDIEAAVHTAQLYIGSANYSSFRDQQRLYQRMLAKIAAVAKRHGVDAHVAHDQIMGEARRRGPVRPLPGQHI